MKPLLTGAKNKFDSLYLQILQVLTDIDKECIGKTLVNGKGEEFIIEMATDHFEFQIYHPPTNIVTSVAIEKVMEGTDGWRFK